MIAGSAAVRFSTWVMSRASASRSPLSMRSISVAASGVPRALGGGFIALTALGLALTDFYLGLAAFHLGVGLTTSLCARRWRWLGVALIVLALVLGALT